MNRGAQYSNKYRWLQDERFLKDLEGDSVDSEILEDELRTLQCDGPVTCRSRLGKVLESNPLQVVLCLLVLIDAGIVVAEIMLDLHSIKGEMRETQQDVTLLLKFVRTEYFRELGGYQGNNITEILTRIKTYRLEASNHSSGVYSNSYVTEATFTEDVFDQEFQQTAEFLAAADDRSRRSSTFTDDQSGSRTSDDVSASAESGSKLQPHISIRKAASNSGKDTFAKSKSLPKSENLTSEIYDNQRPVDGMAVDRSNIFRKLGSAYKSTQLHNFSNTTERRIKRGVTKSNQGGGDGRNNCVCFYGNATVDIGHGLHQAKSQSQLLHEIAHALHFCSIAILGIFVLQVLLRVVALDLEFCRRKMEIFDAIIVIASFAMDLIFLGGIGGAGEEAAALLILFLLWRILRVVNGILVTAKQRQEFRMKLQKRARRRAERKIEMLQDDKHMKEKEISALQDLCSLQGASLEDVKSCKPRRVLKRLDTSSGLTSVASLSLSLSMSMSTGIFGNIVSAARRENSPFAKHKNRAANRKSNRDGTLTPRSAQGSLEDLKNPSNEQLLSVKPRESFATVRERDANKEEGVLEPLIKGASCDSSDEARSFDGHKRKNVDSVSKPASPVCDIIVTIDDTGTSIKNDVLPQTPRKHAPIVPVTDISPTTNSHTSTTSSISSAMPEYSHLTHMRTRSADIIPKPCQTPVACSQSAGSTPKHGQQIPLQIRSAGSTPKRNPRDIIQTKPAKSALKGSVQVPVQNRKPPEITISDCTAIAAPLSLKAKNGAASDTMKALPPDKQNNAIARVATSGSSPQSANKLTNNKALEPDNKTRIENTTKNERQGSFTPAVDKSDTLNTNQPSLAHAIVSKLTATQSKPQTKTSSSDDATTDSGNKVPLKPMVTAASGHIQNHVSDSTMETQPSQTPKVKETFLGEEKPDYKANLVTSKPRNVDSVGDIPKLPKCPDSKKKILIESSEKGKGEPLSSAGSQSNKDAADNSFPAAEKGTQDFTNARDCPSSHPRSVRFQNEVREKVISRDAPVNSMLTKGKNSGGGGGGGGRSGGASGGNGGETSSVIIKCEQV